MGTALYVAPFFCGVLSGEIRICGKNPQIRGRIRQAARTLFVLQSYCKISEIKKDTLKDERRFTAYELATERPGNGK